MPKLKQKKTKIKFKPISSEEEHLFQRVSAKSAREQPDFYDSDSKIAKDWSELCDQVVGCENDLGDRDASSETKAKAIRQKKVKRNGLKNRKIRYLTAKNSQKHQHS